MTGCPRPLPPPASMRLGSVEAFEYELMLRRHRCMLEHEQRVFSYVYAGMGWLFFLIIVRLLS